MRRMFWLSRSLRVNSLEEEHTIQVRDYRDMQPRTFLKRPQTVLFRQRGQLGTIQRVASQSTPLPARQRAKRAGYGCGEGASEITRIVSIGKTNVKGKILAKWPEEF